VLVLRPGALGDTLLAVPALRALRRRFPSEPLRLAAHGETARFLAAVGEIDEGFAFDDPRLGWLFRPSEAFLREEHVVGWLTPQRVPGLRDALLIAPSRPPSETVHCAEYLLRTLEPLGCDQAVDTSRLAVKPAVWEGVLVHPGSGAARKNWPAERFAGLIAQLDGDVALVVGEADADAAGAVEAALGRRIPRVEGLALGELAARLAGCRGYVGNDSGISHLAGLCGARSVVLFGPTSPVVWRPLGPTVSVRSFCTPTEEVAKLVR
jgi:ADP-heptose:LPS heptosyltransferase